MRKHFLSGAAILTLAALALVATAFIPAPPQNGSSVLSLQERIANDRIVRDQAYSVPLMLAQGRCYNGNCY